MTTPIELAMTALGGRIGEPFGPTDPLLVDQAMIDRFADLTGDRQWVHLDVDRAGREIGGTIAHGYLTLSLVPRLTAELVVFTQVGRALNYGLNRVRFTGALRAGRSIRATLRLLAVEPKGDGVMVRQEIGIVDTASDRPVCIAETLVLMFPGEGRLDGQ